MDPMKLALFEGLVAEIFQMVGEMTTLDGAKVAIYIKHPTKNEMVAWPSTEVAHERFKRYQNSSEFKKAKAIKDAKFLLQLLENWETLDLDAEELAILMPFIKEKLDALDATIEAMKRNQQP